MAIYTIRKECEPGAASLGRRINCLTDSEALELAQKMADTGLSLQVWRGTDMIGTVAAGQNVATSEPLTAK